MLISKFILRAAGVSLAVHASMGAQPLKAQASSDADRIEKLERAVQALQQRNVQLESEVSGLKKTQSAFAGPPSQEGKMKTVRTTDGKNYAEKLVPDLSSAEKWKLAPWLTELELFGDLRLRYDYRGGQLPGDDPTHPNDWQERERERYRLRLGLRGTLLDDWFFGLRLETSASARSSNVTMGDDASSSSAGGGGPFAKGAQFVYDDSNPSNPIGTPPTQTQPTTGQTQQIPLANAFLLGWQVGARFDFPKKFYFQLAPALYNYTGNGKDFSVFFSGDPGGNQTGINSLLVFDIPAEIGWKVGKIPMRLFGYFVADFEEVDRDDAAGR